jgi:hypothetical protein
MIEQKQSRTIEQAEEEQNDRKRSRAEWVDRERDKRLQNKVKIGKN